MSVEGREGSERKLPEGNVFGTREDDEFMVNVKQQEAGTFKRFEYYSMPFSLTGQEEIFEEVMQEAEHNGNSFAEELEQHEKALEVV